MNGDEPRLIILRRRAAFLAMTASVVACPHTGAIEGGPNGSRAEATSRHTSSPSPPTSPSPAGNASGSPLPANSVESVDPPVASVVRVCLSIRIIEHVSFARGASSPTTPSDAVIDETAHILSDRPDLRIAIEGHADPSESSSGQELALARAQAVRQRLVQRGVDPARLCAFSFGDTRPLTSGNTDDERAKNRRVSFRLLEKDEPCP